nr:MAG TPA: hypothetical protein [Bacteriophage sp.]
MSIIFPGPLRLCQNNCIWIYVIIVCIPTKIPIYGILI